MKVRLGYVSNSSSSSYVICFKRNSKISISVGEHSVSFDLFDFLVKNFKGGMCDDSSVRETSENLVLDHCNENKKKKIKDQDFIFCELQIGDDDNFSHEVLKFLLENKFVKFCYGDEY